MILVSGANGVVGKPLCQKLGDQGQFFMSVSRQAQTNTNSLVWDMTLQPDEQQKEQLSVVTRLIHCAPIWLLAGQLEAFKETQISRLVVFSSTSVLSKQTSPNASEQSLVNKLAQSEQDISEFCDEQGWNLTILRPSMIYGNGNDQNVAHIARFIQRYHLMFLVGRATGKRQPVHANDLVVASITILDKSSTYGETYVLAGKEVFSYREMVERIFKGLNKKPIILRLPLWLFRLGLRCASLISNFSYTPEMANRMNQDLDYDYSQAEADFAYSPQDFLINPVGDLGGSK